MLRPPPDLKIVLAAYILGSAGACVQSLLLFNELATGFPYTLISAQIYSSIGADGFWISPLASISLTVFVARRSVAAPILVPVLLAPLVFAFTFIFLSGTTGRANLPIAADSDFSPAKAAIQFYFTCLWVAAGGLLAAGVVAVVLKAIEGGRSRV